MPVEYRIDKLAGIVHTLAYGELTDAEAMAYHDGLKADPDFEPSYREFFDFSEVEPFRITPPGIRTLASTSPWGDGALRAFVTHDDLAYGMLRMHQSLLDPETQNIGVFRNASDAWRWLEQAEDQPESDSVSA